MFRDDRLGDLEWREPCRIPAENELAFEPPMYFCSPHFQALVGDLYRRLDAAGLIDRDIVG